ncbi:MAG TPA: hypothetical protein H9692_05430 [Firmicutes bacterium]|nr:hypothetical protein [Bacillota bacterium]
MSIWSKFKSRKFLSVLIIAVAVVVCAILILSIMIPSWVDYKGYYDAAVAEREHKKYLNSLPLELVGISASLNDGVEYFDNGKAAPKADDFEVMAHFTEKGQSRDTLLKSGEYTITVPENFSQSGGAVTVSYTWTPEAAEGETATPVTKTTDIPLSLTPVALDALRVTQKPYRVAYSNAMEFDPAGMEATAVYNDGSTKTVPVGVLDVETKGVLSAGTDSAYVAYTESGVTVRAAVPITVDNESEYSDGAPVAISVYDGVRVKEGTDPAGADVEVRATYINGNRLLMEGGYTLTGNTEVAELSKNCVITVSTEDSGASLTARTVAEVVKAAEAEDASFTAGEEKTVNARYYDDGVLTDGGEATIVDNADTLTFTVSSGAKVRTDLTVRVAVNAAEGEGAGRLADVLALTVNGTEKPIDKNITVEASTDGTYIFRDFVIENTVLNAGDNEITLDFASAADCGYTFGVDKIELSTKYEGTACSDAAEGVADNAATGSVSATKSELMRIWHGNTEYGHGMCTDGKYIYVSYTYYDATERQGWIVRYDPETGETVSSARTDRYFIEKTAGITYYDGKVIMYKAGGGAMYVDCDSFTEGCQLQDYDGFSFEGLENAELYDVYQNKATGSFAVMTANNITLFNSEMKDPQIVPFVTDETGATPKRMTGSNGYIFVNYSKNGIYTPILHVYDWSGKYIGRTVIENTVAAMGDMVTDPANTNTQAILIDGDNVYFTMLKFAGTQSQSSTGYFRAAFEGVPEDRVFDERMNEYLLECVDTGSADDTKIVLAKEWHGSRVYAHAMCSVGRYIYVAYTIYADVNRSAMVTRFDPVTGETVSSAQTGNLFLEKNTGITYYDGKIIIYKAGGGAMYVEEDKFAEGCAFREYNDFNFEGLGSEPLRDVYWNEFERSFAVMSESGLRIYDEYMKSPVTVTLAADETGANPKRMTGTDEYIFVNYSKDGIYTPVIHIYDWDGNHIGRVVVPNKPEYMGDTVTAPTSSNTQAIAFHDGEMWFTMVIWGGTNGAQSNTSSGFFKVTVQRPGAEPEGTVYDSVIESAKSNATVSGVKVERAKDWHSLISNENTYAHGMCTDGKYIYVSYTRYASVNRSALILRYDPATGETVSSAWTGTYFLENSAGLTYYDGKIIIYKADGGAMYVEADKFTEGCTLKDYNGFSFEGLESTQLRDVYYNETAGKFAVMTAGKITFFDSGMKAVGSVTLETDGTGATPKRMTSSGDYIFVSYNKNGIYYPIIHVYDWEGNYVGRTVIDSTASLGAMGSVVVNTNNTNTQALLFLDGDLWFSVLKFSDNGNGSAYIRVTLA